jgi:ferric-dicitrate binding protein FerR (iron transport regulator)
MENKKDLLKWLNREHSDKELMRLKETKNFKTIEKIAHYSSQLATPEVDVTEALANFKNKRKQPLKKGKTIKFKAQQLYKYAATILILCAGVYYFTLENKPSFKTEFAETHRFNLPDSSEVILNANSRISYSKKDWEENRNITLEGEAYFKVQKGEKFTVHTTLGKVSVLGTQFNIKKRAGFFEVKTYEGLVSVEYKNQLINLSEGAVFKVINGVINDNSTFDVNKKSWLQKESNFKSMPLGFVLEELENQFDCEIETENINLKRLYSGGFSHKNLDIALQSVTIPLQLSYEVIGRKITLYNYVQ